MTAGTKKNPREGVRMPTYLYQATEHFEVRLEKIKGNNPQGYDRIRGTIDRILVNPDMANGKMHGPHRDKFKKYVGRREYRLIYYYREMCRKFNRQLSEQCDKCESIPDRSVVFFDVFHKNEKDRMHY